MQTGSGELVLNGVKRTDGSNGTVRIPIKSWNQSGRNTPMLEQKQLVPIHLSADPHAFGRLVSRYLHFPAWSHATAMQFDLAVGRYNGWKPNFQILAEFSSISLKKSRNRKKFVKNWRKYLTANARAALFHMTVRTPLTRFRDYSSMARRAFIITPLEESAISPEMLGSGIRPTA